MYFQYLYKNQFYINLFSICSVHIGFWILCFINIRFSIIDNQLANWLLRNRRFITALTQGHRWPFLEQRLSSSQYQKLTSLKSVLILSFHLRLGLLIGVSSSVLTVCFSGLFHTCFMACPFQSSRFKIMLDEYNECVRDSLIGYLKSTFIWLTLNFINRISLFINKIYLNQIFK